MIIPRVEAFYSALEKPEKTPTCLAPLKAAKLVFATVHRSLKKRLMIWIRQKKKPVCVMPAKIPKPTSFTTLPVTVAADLRQKATLSRLSRVSSQAKTTPNHPQSADKSSKDISSCLKDYLLAVKHTGCSNSTVRNYRSDINQFIEFAEIEELGELGNKPKLLAFAHYQREKGLKESSIKRKLTSVTQFKIWLKDQGLLKLEVPLSVPSSTETSRQEQNLRQVIDQQNPKVSPQTTQIPDIEKNQLGHSQKQRPKKTTSRLIWLLNVLALVFFLGGLAYFAYQQLGQAMLSMAYPSTPTAPNRILSYQGRLTNTSHNPISTPTEMQYRLYDADTGGTLLWSSNTCEIDPDQDGIFNTNLGAGNGDGSDNDNCGGNIPESVFTENSNVWLEVEVLTETLTPRQPIRTVAYALNAATLQGLPPAEVATHSTILMMDQSGAVVLGTDNPVIRTATTSSGLTIEANQIFIQSNSGSNGDLVLTPDGSGIVDIQGDASVSGTSTLIGNVYVSSPNSLIFGGTTALGEISAANDSGAYLIGVYDQFSNSSSTNVQAVLYDLDQAISGVGPNLWTDSGTLTHLTSTSDDFAVGANSLTAPFSVDVSDNIIRFGSGSGSNATLNFYASDGDTGSLTYTTDDAFVFGGGDLGLAASSYLNWGSTIGTGGYGLRDNAGTIQFKNSGGSWADLGSGGGGSLWTNAGTYIHPTSGLPLGNPSSGGSNKISGLYLSDSGPLYFGTDNDINFSFSGSTLATALGSNAWSINSGLLYLDGASNKIGLGTTNPLATLDVRGLDTDTAVASFSGSTNLATLILDQLGSGDIFTASAAGQTQFVITGDGNVGIGLNNPTSRLQIAGASSVISNDSGDITLDAASGNIALANNNLIDVNNGYFLGQVEVGSHASLNSNLWGDTQNNTLSVGREITNFDPSHDFESNISNYLRLDPDDNGLAAISLLNYIETESSNAYNYGYLSGLTSLLEHNGSGTVDIAIGAEIGAYSGGSGTIDFATGLYLYTDGRGAGNIGINNQVLSSGANGSGYTRGYYSTVENSSIITSGNDDTHGSLIAVNRTGATGGTINTYGSYLQLVTDNAGSGTHTAYGLYVDMDGNADYNYAGIFSGGSVGIGTTSPDRRLEILDSSNPQLRLTHTDSSIYADFQMSSNGDLVMNVDGVSNQLVLDNGGNVGIGTSTPDEKLTVNGSVNAEKYYDYTNKTYFLDPAAVSTALNIAGTAVIGGDILPAANDAQDIGSDALRWRDLYLGGETLHIGTSLTDEGTIYYDTTSNIFHFGTDSTSNGDIAFFTNQLYIDKSTGNIGLGISSPGHRLELATHTTAAGGIGFGTDVELYRSAANTLALASGDSLNLVSGSLQVAGTDVITSGRLVLAADGNAGAPGFSFSGDADNGMFRPTTNQLALSTAGTERLRIDADGKVGIGTSTPSTSLHVIGPSDSNQGMYLDRYSDDIGQTRLYVRKARGSLTTPSAVLSGDYLGAFTGAGYDGAAFGDAFVIQAQATQNWTGSAHGSSLSFATVANDSTTATQRMLIDQNGNVGIGSSPSSVSRLHVFSDLINTVTSGQSTITLEDTTSMAANVGAGIAFRGIYTSGGASAGFGGIKAGKSNATSGNLDSYLAFYSRANSGGVLEAMRIDANQRVGMGNTNPGTHRLSVTGTAGLSTGTAWTNTSDFRLKNVESELEGSSLEKILALNPISFRWNSLHNQKFQSDSSKLNYGFIAQEVEAVLPHMITTDEEGYKWYNPSGFEALLTAGIQEQQEQISALAKIVNQRGSVVNSTGELTLTGSSETNYAIATPTGVVNRIAAFADVFVARITAGFIRTRELLAHTVQVSNRLIAERVSTNRLDTKSGQDLLINADTQIAGDLLVSSDLEITGQLEVSGPSKLSMLIADQAVVTNLEAESVRTQTLEARLAELEEATVSGTLYANNIEAQSISANVISGLQERLSDQIERTLSQPSLLASLLGESEQQTEEYLNQLTQEMNATLASASTSLDVLGEQNQDLTMIADSAFINQYFEVNGSAYIADTLKAGQSFMVADHTILGANFISYLPELTNEENFTFSIQPHGLGQLSLLAGLVQLDSQGFVTINGDLRVAGALEVADELRAQGTLLTNLIGANRPGEDIQVQLATTLADSNFPEADGVTHSNFEFVDENLAPVASFSATGDLSLSGSLRLNQGTKIASGSGELSSGGSAGQAVLPAGNTEVVINSDKIESGSMIYITPLNSTNNQVLYVKNKITDDPLTPEGEGQFTVAIDYALGHSVTFNWWIIQLN